MEEGKINDARKKGGEAETLFRDAELSAIKTSFFDETRKLLARAEEEKVQKYAPETLAKSRSLLAEAEAELAGAEEMRGKISSGGAVVALDKLRGDPSVDRAGPQWTLPLTEQDRGFARPQM